MARHALPDGFDDKMHRLALLAEDVGECRMSAEEQHRSCVEIAIQLRRMAAFPRRSSVR